MLLPLCDILAQCLQEANVIACLTQPLGKACPFADQRLVADFDCGCSCNLIGSEQACCEKIRGDLLEQLCLLLCGQHQFRQSCPAASCILFRQSRVDQAQEQSACQFAMLLGG